MKQQKHWKHNYDNNKKKFLRIYDGGGHGSQQEMKNSLGTVDDIKMCSVLF